MFIVFVYSLPSLEAELLFVTAIIGLQGFFPLKGQAAVGIGSVEYPASERKRLATLSVTYFHPSIRTADPLECVVDRSREWTCPHCKQANLALLPDPLTATVATSGHRVDVKETHQPDQTSMTETFAKTPTLTTSTSTAVGISEANPATPASVQIPSDSKSSGPHPQFEPSARSSEISNNDIDSKRTITARMNFDNLGSETSTVFRSRRSRGTTNSRGSQKPPVLLDTAICILLVLLFAIICRRVV
jgi:ubiquitin-conjugating enzyme E2 J1